jgi:5-methyltetrahydrofolate--homocysteine methyltransferase
MPLFKIEEEAKELSRRLVFNEWVDGKDPLQAFMAYFDARKGTYKKEEKKAAYATVEESLKHKIIDGSRENLEKELDQALQKYKPLDIINSILMDGMKVVGELFGAGKMQLPFVLQSAEVMKKAVAYLEPHMEKVSGNEKGRFVLATVKGDVHDIGKNLVDIILTNNGYKVFNLGIKQPVENILQAAAEHNADAIGLSGLLVKSTLIMKENLEEMEKQGISLPVICGGAALNRKYVEEDLRSVYSGSVYYGQDAFSGLNILNDLKDPAKAQATIAEGRARREKKVIPGTRIT